MDSLSPASSATATATCSPGSDGACQPGNAKFIYTTAGTIYNPKASQPLQAPTRRARTLKWPITNTSSSELSLFPKSVLAGLPLRSGSLAPGNQVKLNSAVTEYSPLQQNYDRAVDPGHLIKSSKELEIARVPNLPDMSTARLQKDSSLSPQPAEPITEPSNDERHCVNKDHDSASSDDNLDEHPLRGFPVKSLHNLASYPNPNQKRAQKALLRARPATNANACTGETIGCSVTPIRLDSVHDTVDQTVALFKSGSRSGVAAMQPYHQCAANQTTVAPRRASQQKHIMGGTFDDMMAMKPSAKPYTTLSSGPGAPRPLTAGPPGQRQYKASTFDSTIRALQSRKQTDTPNSELDAVTAEIQAFFDSSKDRVVQTPPVEFLQSSNSTHPIQRRLNPTALGRLRATSTAEENCARQAGHGSVKSILHAFHEGDDIADTKTSSEISKYYAHGFVSARRPVNFDPYWPNENPLQERRPWKPGTFARTDEELKKYNERVGELFYAGCDEVHKGMAHVIRDAGYRQFKRGVGVIGDGRPRYEDVDRQELTIEEANATSTTDDAAPLMIMAFSTLVRIMEYLDLEDQYSQFVSPRPSLVDTSPEGTCTFFGNTNIG